MEVKSVWNSVEWQTTVLTHGSHTQRSKRARTNADVQIDLLKKKTSKNSRIDSVHLSFGARAFEKQTLMPHCPVKLPAMVVGK